MKRATLGLFGLWWMAVACASEGTRPAPDEGVDDSPMNGGDASNNGETSGADSPERADAQLGTESREGDASRTTRDAAEASVSDQTSGHNAFHDRDAFVPDEPQSDAGSLIIEPVVEVYDIPSICNSLWELQGQVIETNLAGHVLLGAWSVVQDFSESDSGVQDVPLATFDAGFGLGADASQAALDARVCRDEFAPYLVWCEQGPILLQSPELVYTGGPVLGGEQVNMGCWERECRVECIPESADVLAGVRARLSAVAPTADSDGGEPNPLGVVRLNGVEVEVVATLEITGGVQ